MNLNRSVHEPTSRISPARRPQFSALMPASWAMLLSPNVEGVPRTSEKPSRSGNRGLARDGPDRLGSQEEGPPQIDETRCNEGADAVAEQPTGTDLQQKYR